MNWLTLLAAAIGVLVLLTIIGLIKNFIKTGIAVLAGYLVAVGLSYGAVVLGIEGIPDMVFVFVGVVAGLAALARMKH